MAKRLEKHIEAQTSLFTHINDILYKPGLTMLDTPKDQNLSQKERIIEYLKENGKIDRLSAFLDLGIFELSARICDLQREGYQFDKETKQGVSKRGYEFDCTEYRMRG